MEDVANCDGDVDVIKPTGLQRLRAPCLVDARRVPAAGFSHRPTSAPPPAHSPSACFEGVRSAIMFGDNLGQDESVALRLLTRTELRPLCSRETNIGYASAKSTGSSGPRKVATTRSKGLCSGGTH